LDRVSCGERSCHRRASKPDSLAIQLDGNLLHRMISSGSGCYVYLCLSKFKEISVKLIIIEYMAFFVL
jgi:hypothetical protein